jgi:hypothetical protein
MMLTEGRADEEEETTEGSWLVTDLPEAGCTYKQWNTIRPVLPASLRFGAPALPKSSHPRPVRD